MPKQIVVMMSDHYPFGQCQQNINQDARILVRKIFEVGVQQRNRLLQKANILKRLKSEQLIKLQSVLQEDQSVHFLFQYVPIRLQTWISNINDQFIQNFRDQLVKFSNYLANNCVKIEFKLKNIGMDQDYGAKYFLDPGFLYDPTINKERLKSQYIRDIYNLFKPYIENQNNKDQEIQKKQQEERYMMPVTQQNVLKQTVVQKNQQNSKPVTKAVSPPTFNQGSQNRRKQPNLKGYPTDINVSVDEQVLTDILGVLDDEDEEEQVYRPKSYTQTGQDTYFSEAKYEPPQKSSSNNGMMKQSGGYEPAQNKGHNAFDSFNNKTSLEFQLSKNQSQNISQSQSQRPKQTQMITSSQPKITRTSQIESSKQPQQQRQSSQFQEQLIWRDGEDLQNRIKKAIQNSRSIIKRFKAFKGEGQA